VEGKGCKDSSLSLIIYNLPIQKIVNQHYHIRHTNKYLHVAFDTPHFVLSSAVLNGGFVEAGHIINLKVEKSMPDKDIDESPADFIQKYCRSFGLTGRCVGLMTAASMGSMRCAKHEAQSVEISVLVTAGLSNLRRAGDRCDYRKIDTQETVLPGTINTIILSNISLTRSAMVEAAMIATEAKVAALQDIGVLSPVSNAIATGTGTDALAIACGFSRLTIAYAGKHTLFGELLAKAVLESTTASVKSRLTPF